jgi:hypothetical protein
MLFFWPFLTIPIQFIFIPSSLTVSAVVSLFFVSILIVGLTRGCGARYRYRGINPSSRNIINVGDGHYFERIGPDESDYV